MIHGHRGHDTNTPPLFLQVGCHAIGGCAVRRLTDHTVVGLLARSEASACRSGVGDTIRSGESGSLTRIRELGHEQWHTTVLTLQSCLVHLGGEHLVRSHAIANEEEYILGLSHYRYCQTE